MTQLDDRIIQLQHSIAYKSGPCWQIETELFDVLVSLRRYKERLESEGAPLLNFAAWSAIYTAITGRVILDPDGFRESWPGVISGVREDKLYTVVEFMQRLPRCTTGHKAGS